MTTADPGITTRSHWSPVLAYAAVSAANQMLWLTFTPFTTAAARHYGVSVDAVGWLAEVFPLVYVVLALPTGRLIDRSLRTGLLIGAGLTAAGAVLRLAGGVFATVLLGQLLIAVAQPFVLNAVTKLSGHYLRPVDRPTGIAVSSAGIFAGMVLALLTGTVAGVHHLTALLIGQAAFAVVAGGWLLLSLGWMASTTSRSPDGPADRAHASREPASAGARAVLADPVLRLLVLLALGGFGVFVALTTWLQALLLPAGVGASAAGTLLLVMVLAGVFGSGLLPGPIVRHDLEMRFLIVSVIAGAASMCWLATGPGFVAALPALLVLGIALLTALPVILGLIERRSGDAAGMATALLWLAGNLGGLVLALIVQVLVHEPTVAFLIMAAALLALLPVLAALRSLLPRPVVPADQT